jgi:hypothetical protein
MNTIPYDLIKYNINSYLILNDKINLRVVNKKFKKIQKKIIWYHFGEILINKLGINLKTINEDMELFKEYRLDFINEIIYICFREKEYYQNSKIYGLKIPLYNLFKINKSSLEECKRMIIDKTLKSSKKYKLGYISSNYYKKNYYTSYALLF